MSNLSTIAGEGTGGGEEGKQGAPLHNFLTGKKRCAWRGGRRAFPQKEGRRGGTFIPVFIISTFGKGGEGTPKRKDKQSDFHSTKISTVFASPDTEEECFRGGKRKERHVVTRPSMIGTEERGGKERVRDQPHSH